MKNRLRLALVASALALFSTDTFAQPPFLPLPGMQGTPEEQAACKPDVIKLCKGIQPDQFLILDCLKRNRPRLSRPCNGVLESHGQ